MSLIGAYRKIRQLEFNGTNPCVRRLSTAATVTATVDSGHRARVFIVECDSCIYQGIARTQSPTNINYAPESPTFGVIAEVSPSGVQWTGLALGEPP